MLSLHAISDETTEHAALRMSMTVSRVASLSFVVATMTFGTVRLIW